MRSVVLNPRIIVERPRYYLHATNTTLSHDSRLLIYCTNEEIFALDLQTLHSNKILHTEALLYVNFSSLKIPKSLDMK